MKTADRIGIPRSTCCDIVQRNKERREPESATRYTASAPRSGRPEKLNWGDVEADESQAKAEPRLYRQSETTSAFAATYRVEKVLVSPSPNQA